jgi:hypothetical protein
MTPTLSLILSSLTPNMNSPTLNISMTLSAQATDLLAGDDTDTYSEFDEDPETLALIDALLNVATNTQQQAQALEEGTPIALEVTDIEDYEAPKGVRLPKVFGVEARRQWSSTQPQQQVIRDKGGTLHLYLIWSTR